MAKKFSELRNKMSPEAQARVVVRTESLLTKMQRQEMRKSLNTMQTVVAPSIRED